MNIFGLGGLYGVYGGFGYNSLGTGYLGTGYLSSGYLGSGCSGTGSLIYNSLNNTALKQVNGINSGFAQAASPSFSMFSQQVSRGKAWQHCCQHSIQTSNIR